MPRDKGYKDRGDRVVVINPAAFGEHGKVRHNDGFGEVMVDLDDGQTFAGYEGRDLIYEDEPLPEKPIDPEESGSEHPDEVLETEGGQKVLLTTYKAGEKYVEGN